MSLLKIIWAEDIDIVSGKAAPTSFNADTVSPHATEQSNLSAVIAVIARQLLNLEISNGLLFLVKGTLLQNAYLL